MMVQVKIRKINSSAKLPEKKSQGAAAWDLYSTEEVYIPPQETATVGTGISLEIPQGWKGEIYSRSGMAADGVFVSNQPGKIDSDYRGEIKVILFNSNKERGVACIKVGSRIAQIEINPVQEVEWEEVEELEQTERAEEGLGSTGV